MNEGPHTEPWFSWAQELQFLAQSGLAYTNNCFDIERYARIREIAAEILSYRTDRPLPEIQTIFCNETGYQTPKLDCRAAVFSDGKILLVQERTGLWALPGGWVDVNQSVGANTIKEVKEEAGLDVSAIRIIAIQDRNQHNWPVYIYGICKIFVLCEYLGGAFHENIETLASDFFTLDNLPPLSENKTTIEQIKMCFRAQADPHWRVQFD